MNQRKARPRASLFTLEPLENRRHLSVSRDSNGWTVVDPSADTRIVYVSSSIGSDTNDGLSQDAPVQSLAKGASLLRSGMPDWLLLKRGDEWTVDGFTGQFNDWQISGRSADEPLLISAYGSGARPLLKTGPSSGMWTIADPENYVAIMGLEFYADTRDPNSPNYTGDTTGHVGMNFLTNGNSYSWLIEDCKLSFYNAGIVFAGAFHDITIRRNIIVDSYSTTDHSSGIYAYGTDGLTIEENVLDHNGWNEQIAGAEASIFNHNIYLADNNDHVVVRNNLIANASSHGLQARSGGQIYGNLFINNPIGMLMAVGKGRTGSGDYVKDNVFVGSATISGAPRGNAIDINGANNLTISGNIAYSGSRTSGGGINVRDAEGINGLTIENNVVHDWYIAMTFDPTLIPGGVGTHALNGVTIRNNKYSAILCSRVVDHYGPYSPIAESWQGNTYSDINDPSGWFTIQGVSTSLNTWLATIDRTGSAVSPTYADPTRNIGTYNASVGGTASVEAFLAQARLQSKPNWRPPYTTEAAISYIHAGFFRAGDFNMDGSVTIADFITLAAHFGQSDQTWTTGDLNGDGTVTVSDMIDLASNWGVVSQATPNQIAMFADAISLDSNGSTSPQDDPDQSSIILDSVNLGSDWDVLSMRESNKLGEENLAPKLLTASTPKGIIRPVWFTYPRR